MHVNQASKYVFLQMHTFAIHTYIICIIVCLQVEILFKLSILIFVKYIQSVYKLTVFGHGLMQSFKH